MPSISYCQTCLLPSTKPYIRFDDHGICNACLAARKKTDSIRGIDWQQRQQEFEALIQWAKAQKAPYYDAMVPVSGGKDSITQVHRLLGHDLRILAVNVDYGIKTEIGHFNLERIPLMGANLLIFRPELPLHKQLIRIGLEEFGDPDLLSHTLLHAYPLHIARQFQVPLCLLGENSAFEYGGADDLSASNQITRGWFDSYAANKGMTARVVSERYEIPYTKLWQYDFPDAIEQDPNIQEVFSSYYFPWDSHEHLRIAKTYGFKELDQPKEGTYRTFVGIDEQINRLHQYIKVLKFGYGRATDHACEDIRLGLLTREQAKELVRQYDLQPLGDEFIADICAFLDYEKARFLDILEKYRDVSIWRRDQHGDWFIPGHLEDNAA